MTAGTILSMLIAIVVPALVAIVTRASLPPWAHQALLTLFATITGVVSAVVTSPPTNLSGWEHLVLNIVVAFVAAEASSYAQEKAQATKALHHATDHLRFGIGKYDPTLDLDKAA